MRAGIIILVSSAAVGATAALLTALLQLTPSGLVGATWYGYPLPWLYRLVLAPQYYPWRVSWQNLILDAGLWFFVTLFGWLIVMVWLRYKPRAPW